jgi:hypothetical protein
VGGYKTAHKTGWPGRFLNFRDLPRPHVPHKKVTGFFGKECGTAFSNPRMSLKTSDGKIDDETQNQAPF